MVVHNDIFVADIKDIEYIYWAKIPYYNRGLQLKIKKDKLDLPIFCEPERSKKGYQTSEDKPLKSRMWSCNIKWLGFKAGLEENLTQKVLQYGTINAVNNMNLPAQFS